MASNENRAQPNEKRRTFRCPHCGRLLKSRSIDLAGKTLWIADEVCTCEGTLKAAKEEADRRREAEEAARKRRWISCGIEERFHGADLVRCPFADMIKRIDYRGGEGLFVIGGIGSGKTELVSALAIWLLDQEIKPRLVTTPKLITKARTCIARGESEYEMLRDCAAVDVLILEDFDKASGSEWELRTLYQLIDERYGRKKSTVTTCHCGYSALIKRLARKGEAQSAEEIVSRIRETSRLIQLPDKNWRLESRRIDG